MVHSGQDEPFSSLEQSRLHQLLFELSQRVESEIRAHAEGKGSVSTPEELSHILSELGQMRQAMSPRKFMPGFSYVIIDQWDMNTELGEHLLRAYRLYRGMKQP